MHKGIYLNNMNSVVRFSKLAPFHWNSYLLVIIILCYCKYTIFFVSYFYKIVQYISKGKKNSKFIKQVNFLEPECGQKPFLLFLQ